MDRLSFLLNRTLLSAGFIFAMLLATRAQPAAQLEVLDRSGKPTTAITDGNSLRLRLTLTERAAQETAVNFTLDGLEAPVANCTIPSGETACESALFSSTGWHWQAGGVAAAQRRVQASLAGAGPAAEVTVQVAARPVVMVHGFISSWEAWQNYLGPGGYLASIGVPGFAVGDGQAPGVLNTGSLADPTARTNTILENATILGEYIAGVKTQTGAERVDLLVHSMGGLIARRYIHEVMAERDVVQLIMLGSPALGTACANLPAGLNFYLPATLEIRPSYAHQIFNPQVTARKGVAFHALAGVPILEPIQSPCTSVPSDIVISKESVGGVPLHLTEMPLLHTELNTSQEVFSSYVRPRLQKLPGEYPDEPDPPLPESTGGDLQFSRVFSGRLAPGESVELVIPIESGVAVASFALYDPSRSLEVSVRGANGNEIVLDPVTHGLRRIDDPETLVHLGYGFNNPRPGRWVTRLETTANTPTEGAFYALSAQYQGGARLQAGVSNFLPEIGEPVELSAQITAEGMELTIENAQAQIRHPDGRQETLALVAAGEAYRATWTPPAAGLYGVDFLLTGQAAPDLALERAAYLTLQVQPAPESTRQSAGLLLGGGVGLLLVLTAGLVFFWRRRKRRV